MSGCNICLEYRANTDDPNGLCGYCAQKPIIKCAFSIVDGIAKALNSPDMAKIAGIVKIAEKLSRGECGYDDDDLQNAIDNFKE